jgi:hypothetical protein
MANNYIESQTAYKIGWGSTRWRRVGGLLPTERQAVRDGNIVWFEYKPWHHMQTGYKVVTVYGYRFDSREPTDDELASIINAKKGVA